jgi:hypothetical protein
MADVHEVYTPRRRRIWPAVVMFLLIVLLIGIIVAMIMNIRASISWPAGGVEFGFRPNIYVQRVYPAAELPAATRVASDVAPVAEAPVPEVTQPSAVEAPSAPPQPLPPETQERVPPPAEPVTPQ